MLIDYSLARVSSSCPGVTAQIQAISESSRVQPVCISIADFADVRFLPNSSVALIFDTVGAKYSATKRAPEYVASDRIGTYSASVGSA